MTNWSDSMDTYGVAEAKARLSDILERVEAGERVTVTRRGVAIAVISPVRPTGATGAIDWKALADFRATLPKSKTSAVRLVRAMRDLD